LQGRSCSKGSTRLTVDDNGEFVYYDFASQCRRLTVVKQGVLGLGLIMVHVYYEIALQGNRLKVD
jgi:hypothetical protein